MCYDISFSTTIELATQYITSLVFDAQLDFDFTPVDHIQGIGLYQRHGIVYKSEVDQPPSCRMMEWGVIPHYAKSEPTILQRNGYLNARSERVLDDKSSYWYKVRNKRCLIPCTGIFEHRKVEGFKKKVPYLIKPLEQQDMFFLPALRSEVVLPDKLTGQMTRRFTFTLITRAANEVMKQIHNDGENKWRMPLFLPLELSREFLASDLTEGRYKDVLHHEMPSEDLVYFPVDTIRTNKPRANGKRKIDYYEWPNLPPLGQDSLEAPTLFS